MLGALHGKETATTAAVCGCTFTAALALAEHKHRTRLATYKLVLVVQLITAGPAAAAAAACMHACMRSSKHSGRLLVVAIIWTGRDLDRSRNKQPGMKQK
jgi:hypothetical protein